MSCKMANPIKTGFGTGELIAAIKEGTPIPMTRLEIAVTNSCTFACDYCTEISLEKATLPREKVLSLIDSASGLGTEVVSLTGGEATIANHLPEIIRRITGTGMFSKVTTNGYGRNAENEGYVRQLLEAGLSQITVSYYSADSGLYAQVAGREDAKEKVEAFMRMLQRLKSAGHGFFWNVNTLTDNLNYRELPAKLEFISQFEGVDRAVPLVVKRRRDRFLSMQDINAYYSGVLPAVEALGLEDRFPLMYKEARRLFGTTEEERERAAQGLYWIVDAERCYHNFNSLFIANDGNAYHCFVFHLHHGEPLGNVHELPLNEIWSRHQERMKTLDPSTDPVCQAHRCNPDITAYNKATKAKLR